MNTTTTQPHTTQKPAVQGGGNVTATVNDRITITYKERVNLKEVRCTCGKVLFEATPGSVVQKKCKCGKTDVYKVAA